MPLNLHIQRFACCTLANPMPHETVPAAREAVAHAMCRFHQVELFTTADCATIEQFRSRGGRSSAQHVPAPDSGLAPQISKRDSMNCNWRSRASKWLDKSRMQHQGDISWPVLRRIVRDWAGESAELVEVDALDGGSISTTLLLHTKAGDKAVLKLSQHRVDTNYQREAHQLNILRNLGIPTPRVYSWKTGTLEDPHSYLLMEHMSGVDLSHARQQGSGDDYDALQRQLADIVATMHSVTGANYCRLLPDELRESTGAKRHDRWPAFFREVYDPIWHEASKMPVLPLKCRRTIGRIHERLDKLLAHDDVPRLVHWDIWSSNILAAPDDTGRWRITALLDPNCKFAHAEAELAYIELFHTGSGTFNKAYHERHKLDDGYHRIRRSIYQLYPLINDLQLFGSEYAKPLMAAVERLAPMV
jgi:fructosamine-3-kinase